MKASEFLEKYERREREENRQREESRQRKESGEETEKDHSLQAQAKERAQHPDHLNAGTPFDWEDMEAYEKELKRLDREGPGKRGS